MHKSEHLYKFQIVKKKFIEGVRCSDEVHMYNVLEMLKSEKSREGVLLALFCLFLEWRERNVWNRFFTFSLYALSFSLVSKVCHVFPGLKSDFDGYTVANRVEIFPPCPVNASKSLHENWKRISVNGHRTWLPIVPNK